MSTPGKSRPDASGSSNWHVRLREVLESYFDENDIETLCFDLRFDYERLAGEGKTRKIVELIKEFARLGRVGELIDYCSRQRPNVAWAELRQAALKNPLVVDREPDVGQAGTTPQRQKPEPPAPKRSSLPSIVAIALVAVAVVVFIVRPSPPFPPPGPTPTPTSRGLVVAPAHELAPPAPDGYIVNVLSGKCIDAKGTPGVANDTPLQLWDCEFADSSSDQRWEFTSDGFIRSKLSGKCIDARGKPGVANETPLQLADCEFSDKMFTDQRWVLRSDGFIVSSLSGKCIDAKGKPGLANETPLQLWDCEYSDPSTDMKWILK